jgi:uncharacterized coiled-coil DUF342 family protein
MTSSAIRQLAEESHAQAQSIQIQVREAQRALASAIVGNLPRKAEAAGKELARIRCSIQQAEDAAASLHQLAVEVEHQEATAELAALMAERETVAAKADALDAKIEQLEQPPFTGEHHVERNSLQGESQALRTKLFDIDHRADALRLVPSGS